LKDPLAPRLAGRLWLEVSDKLPDHFTLFLGKLRGSKRLVERPHGHASLSILRVGLSQIGEAGTQRLMMLSGQRNHLSQGLDLLILVVGGIGRTCEKKECLGITGEGEGS